MTVCKMTVVYDGQCPICRDAMSRLQRRFGDVVEGVDFRRVPPESVHPTLSLNSAALRMHVIEDGRLYSGAAAFVRILRRHRAWRAVTWLYHVPPFGFAAERVYDFIAHHRLQLSKWLGRGVECTDACRVHRGQR